MLTHVRRPVMGMLAIALCCAGVVASADPAARPSRAKYNTDVYFSPNGGAADATAAAIAGARKTVDVAMYSIHTSGAIFTALEQAVARGVTVRMVLNKAGGEAKAKSLKLESIGVDVRYVGKTMHEKFAIADGRLVLNGSGNWSTGADTKYNENMVSYKKHPGLVEVFQGEFDYLWATARDFRPDGTVGAAADPDAAPPAGGGGATSAYFTSANDTDGESVIASRIIDAIRSAQSSVVIAVAHFNHPDIAAALLELHKERNQNADPDDDVAIRVLVDQGEYGASISQVKNLEARKVPVRYKTYSMAYTHGRAQLMHHKYLLVDDATLITGSYNWSKTAEHANYENIVVVEKNPYLARKFGAEFEKLWGLNRDRYDAFRTAVLSRPGEAGYKRVIPVHFDTPYFSTPMTLTRAETGPLRSTLWKIGFYKSHKFVEASFFDKEKGQPALRPPSGSFTDAPATGASVVELLGGR